MTRKRIALFLDGTWNNVDANTNVWRLRSMVAETDAAGLQQRAYYHAGVGSSAGERVRGGALGYGLGREVMRAYRWLIENYEDGDDIFIFGFSRGAFTARSLAGMIASCGLLRPGAPLSVEQLFDRYRLHKQARPIWKILFETGEGRPISGEEQRLIDYSRRVPIKMLGVWDTVGALGIPFGNIPGLSRRSFQFYNTNLSKLYENAYHAMAIDEHRPDFKATLWTRFTPAAPDPNPRHDGDQKVEQRWFVGAHANVGGGSMNDELPQVPLAWLKDKAEQLGLAFRSEVPLRGREHMGPVSDSFASFMWGLYRFARLGRRHHRVIGADTRTVARGTSDTVNETIDATVFERWRRDASYRPPGLVDWAARRGADPAAVASAIDAKTLQPL
jgi:uncharacterized protein (DUF2235 family)